MEGGRWVVHALSCVSNCIWDWDACSKPWNHEVASEARQGPQEFSYVNRSGRSDPPPSIKTTCT